jgi:hypothetical protein
MVNNPGYLGDVILSRSLVEAKHHPQLDPSLTLRVTTIHGKALV